MTEPLLSAAARTLLAGPALADVVTIAADGSPQVSAVWVGLDGDDLVFGTQRTNAKVVNLSRDPRISASFEGPAEPGAFLQPHLVVHGTATVEEIGAEAWIERMDALAQLYMGAPFPHRGGGEHGVWVRITPTRTGGAGF